MAILLFSGIMNILQINTSDVGGGAEGSALNLHRAYLAAGHNAVLAVGTRHLDLPGVLEIPRHPDGGMLSAISRFLRHRERRLPGARKAARILERLTSSERIGEWRAGLEEFAFPGCAQLLEQLPFVPDVIHCHNLHGWYFDLRLLAPWSQRIPVILNLRDTWALAGHCAYFMDCERWRNGCGNCPRLGVYPAIRRDASHENWQRKKEVYAQSRLFVTAPSHWLIDQAKASMLNALEYKVIPNGIDTAVFCPGDRAKARQCLGLPQDVQIAMFASASAKTVFKAPECLAACVRTLADRRPSLHFLCVGSVIDTLRDLPNVHCIPYVSSPVKMADCYRSANIFIHTARAEAFGKTIVEAMACGVPVAATAVGGIPELIAPGENGDLAPLDKPAELAAKCLALLDADLSTRTIAASASLFSIQNQVRNFLDWYGHIANVHCSG